MRVQLYSETSEALSAYVATRLFTVSTAWLLVVHLTVLLFDEDAMTLSPRDVTNLVVVMT